jgi:hypothetical protein
MVPGHDRNGHLLVDAIRGRFKLLEILQALPSQEVVPLERAANPGYAAA